MVVHLAHLQDTFSIPSYSADVMPMQVLWYYIEYSSLMMAARDQPTCNSHQPQGYTDWLHMAGPGFVSMSPHAKSTNSKVVPEPTMTRLTYTTHVCVIRHHECFRRQNIAGKHYFVINFCELWYNIDDARCPSCWYEYQRGKTPCNLRLIRYQLVNTRIVCLRYLITAKKCSCHGENIP